MHILHIISSPRKGDSFSIKLGQAIVERLQAAHPGSTVQVRNLAAEPFPHLEEVHIQSFYTPAEHRSPEQQVALRHSDEAIAELQAADAIVIGAPLYNFGIASALKTWIDHVARVGVTFRYTAQGPEGLVKNKQVYIAATTGGVYSAGPMQAYDFVAPYLQTVLGFLGMTDVTVFRVENTIDPARQQEALAKGIASITLPQEANALLAE